MEKKILVIAVSGIGNTILFTPALSILKNHSSDAKIDFFVKQKAITEVLEENPAVDEIFCYDAKKTLFDKIRLLLYLRKRKYDLSITAFPSNSIQFNILAWVLGARLRLTHKYKYARFRTLSFLQNRKIEAYENVHDVENNVNLLKLIGINPQNKELKEVFIVNKEIKENVSQFFKSNIISKGNLIGIHPGCKAKDDLKRWPINKFIELVQLLLADGNTVLLFSGPDDISFVNDIYKKTGEKCVLITNKSLKEVAAFIEKCDVFLSTDSGLGHIATALDIETITMMGPANHVRIRPYGKTAHLIRDETTPCSPCMKYPFKAMRDKLKCKRNKECLEKISVEEVYKRINSLLKDK